MFLLYTTWRLCLDLIFLELPSLCFLDPAICCVCVCVCVCAPALRQVVFRLLVRTHTGVFTASAHATARCVLKHVRAPRLVPRLLDGATDRNTVRVRVDDDGQCS